MEDKHRFVSLATTGKFTLTELGPDFEVSRKTGHKWLRRYQAAGAPGLQDNGADFRLSVKANHAALQQCRRPRALPPKGGKSIAAAKKCANCAGWARRRKRSAVWERNRSWK